MAKRVSRPGLLVGIGFTAILIRLGLEDWPKEARKVIRRFQKF